MDRVLNTESKEAREEVMKFVLHFMSRLGYDLNKVTVAMDAYCRVRLSKYGTDIQPILSTIHRKSGYPEFLDTQQIIKINGSLNFKIEGLQVTHH